MAVLKQVTGDLAGTLVDLKNDVTVIGRLPEWDIILGINGVSRRHAAQSPQSRQLAFVLGRSRVFEQDACRRHRGSTGGVEHPLKENHRINICGVEFVYHAVAPPEPKDPEPAADVMVVTESDGSDMLDVRTLEAHRTSTMASAVRPEAKLKAILDISKSLSSELRIDAVAPKILDSLMEIFPGAERLFLMLEDPASKRLVRKAFKHRPQKRTSFLRNVPEDEVPTSISRSIVEYVLGQKKAVLSQDAGADKNLPSSASISDLKIRSVMCVPLLTPDNKALGILQLDTSDRRQFGEEDLDVLLAVASQAAISIQNASMLESLLQRERLNRDLKIAEQVQKKFLPQSVPTSSRLQVFRFLSADL